MVFDGIDNYRSHAITLSGKGEITSSTDFLDIRLHTESYRYKGMHIFSAVVDSGCKMGLRLSGSHLGGAYVYFSGTISNTFTGDVYISGRGNVLVLEKDDGAISVRGDISVSNEGVIIIKRSNQTLPSSILKINSSHLEFGNIDLDLSNRFLKLVVEGGSILNFCHYDEARTYKSKRYLYLDDIDISQDGSLIVKEWSEGRDFLLVRKGSNGLDDALKKLEFEGYDRNNIHLVDYNKDYWEISAAPEPAIFGAIFGLAGLAVVVVRRRQRKRSFDTIQTGPRR